MATTASIVPALEHARQHAHPPLTREREQRALEELGSRPTAAPDTLIARQLCELIARVEALEAAS